MQKGTYKHSPETRLKISKALTGRKLSEDHKKKIIKNLNQKKGEESPKWNGGRINASGYIKIYKPEHPRASRNYVYEHIIIMEEILGRPISIEEHIHHINLDRSDNRPENLVVVTRNQHQKIIQKSIRKITKEWFSEQINKGNIIYNKQKKVYIKNEN